MSALEELVASLAKIPGIGRKSALRAAYYILGAETETVEKLGRRILEAKTKIIRCAVCGCYGEADTCALCDNPLRDRSILCIVEQPQDAANIEASKAFNGLYHVLGGVLAPLEGIGPEDLRIEALLERLEEESPIKEAVLATSLTVEGDATALYIQRLLKNYDVRVTRIASGLPAGGGLEFADRLTLSRSLQGRSGFGA